MKTVFVIFSLIGFLALSFFSDVANAQKKTNNEKAIEPTAKEAIRQVLLNGDISLSSGKNCKSVGTSKDDKTILDFLSGVLSFQTEPNYRNSLEFTFRQDKGKRGEIVWICDLLFKTGDEESPASNGIRFTMRNSDRRFMRESVMCIGTG